MAEPGYVREDWHIEYSQNKQEHARFENNLGNTGY